MEYYGIKTFVSKWNVSRRRIQELCKRGRIPGAKKIGHSWAIPENAEKPADARYSRKLSNRYKYTSIDLFAGPGGLCTGFRWAGIKALIAVEWSYWTAQTYSKTHDAEIFDLEAYLNGSMESPEEYFQPSERTLLIYGDINKVSGQLINKILNQRFKLTTVDIVTGGAPCESFSMAGDRKEDDDRNELYANVLRIARSVNSKMFMFENVKGLLSKKNNGVSGAMYKRICNIFQEDIADQPSYTLADTSPEHVLLKAIDYGVPQSRERLFLVGINNTYPDAEYSYPEKTNGDGRRYPYVTVADAIMDLPQIESGAEESRYFYDMNFTENEARKLYLERVHGGLSMAPRHLDYDSSIINNHKAPGHTKKMMERIKSIRQGEGMKAAYLRLISEGKKDFVESVFPKKIYAARNRRLKPNEPSFTVTSHCLDEMIHPYLDRGLTPREAARLQSFPDWYKFQGPYVKFHSDPEQDQYEQIGDAIPPLLAYALGTEVVNTLKYIHKIYR